MMTIGLSVCTMMQLIRAANHPHTAPTLPVRPPLTRSHRYCSSLAISRTAASATRRDAVLLELATLVYPLSVQNAKADERDLEPNLRWKTYVGRDFIFQYPVSLFKESEELRQDGFGDGAAGEDAC